MKDFIEKSEAFEDSEELLKKLDLIFPRVMSLLITDYLPTFQGALALAILNEYKPLSSIIEHLHKICDLSTYYFFNALILISEDKLEKIDKILFYSLKTTSSSIDNSSDWVLDDKRIVINTDEKDEKDKVTPIELLKIALLGGRFNMSLKTGLLSYEKSLSIDLVDATDKIKNYLLMHVALLLCDDIQLFNLNANLFQILKQRHDLIINSPFVPYSKYCTLIQKDPLESEKLQQHIDRLISHSYLQRTYSCRTQKMIARDRQRPRSRKTRRTVECVATLRELGNFFLSSPAQIEMMGQLVAAIERSQKDDSGFIEANYAKIIQKYSNPIDPENKYKIWEVLTQSSQWLEPNRLESSTPPVEEDKQRTKEAIKKLTDLFAKEISTWEQFNKSLRDIHQQPQLAQSAAFTDFLENLDKSFQR
jgi:hypothetical protein